MPKGTKSSWKPMKGSVNSGPRERSPMGFMPTKTKKWLRGSISRNLKNAAGGPTPKGEVTSVLKRHIRAQKELAAEDTTYGPQAGYNAYTRKSSKPSLAAYSSGDSMVKYAPKVARSRATATNALGAQTQTKKSIAADNLKKKYGSR